MKKFASSEILDAEVVVKEAEEEKDQKSKKESERDRARLRAGDPLLGDIND